MTICERLTQKYGIRFGVIGADPYVFGTYGDEARKEMALSKRELVACTLADDLIARAQRTSKLHGKRKP